MESAWWMKRGRLRFFGDRTQMKAGLKSLRHKLDIRLLRGCSKLQTVPIVVGNADSGRCGVSYHSSKTDEPTVDTMILSDLGL